VFCEFPAMSSSQHGSHPTYGGLPSSTCLSLADGYYANCHLVHEHHQEIGAPDDEILVIPNELSSEFEKLSPTIMNLGRAFELGLLQD